jgi:AraC family transcriptional regulator of adaptative response/methylated-DNA-[protein]-cysteine methyltransferase
MATMAVDHLDAVDEREAWRAVESRNANFDGRFVYGVTSTGVYCRPSCPSRRPSRANARFFPDPEAAEAAGFRACMRCKPRQHQSDIESAVETAREYLDRFADRAVSLTELAETTGVSAAHLQRSFKRIIGVSPKEYQSAQRSSRLKARLRAGDTVSRATYEAGYGSSSRLYEHSDEILGMTPASYKRGGAGVRIAYAIGDAPVGRVLVGVTERGVAAVEIGKTDADVIDALYADFPNATIERSDDDRHTWVRAVLDRIRDPRSTRTHRIPLDVAGTAFQLKVWKALQEIPPGQHRSYADLAAAIGQPSAVRAVAGACAANRHAVVIPCHRAIRSDGTISGYKWGVPQKRRLLNEEAD